MAWTSPRTWVAGEKPSAATMNAHIRDNLLAIGDAWTSYTPTWTGATTNPVLGNGTIVGKYLSAGKLTAFRITLTMGSTTTYGTGQWRLTLPVAPSSARWNFLAEVFDTSTASRLAGTAVYEAANSALALWSPGASAGGFDRVVSVGLPITWATGDQVNISGVYEAA